MINGDYGVDGFEISLYGLVDGFVGKNVGGFELGMMFFFGVDGVFVIDGVVESIDDMVEKFGFDGNVDNFVGMFDGFVFFDKMIRIEKYDIDLVGF